MTDVIMSGDPWFVDLNGTKPVISEADNAEREQFYQKIIDIGRAIQSSLPKVDSVPITSQVKHVEARSQPLPIPQKRSQPVAQPPAPIAAAAVKLAKSLTAGPDNGKAQAEVQAKRRRIEATLYSKSGGKQSFSRSNSGEDIETGLNGEDILSRAHMLVAPVSGLQTYKAPASESFDENDYYSSQADSFTSSPKESVKAVEAESLTKAASDGEVSEDEFEPALETQAPANLSTQSRPDGMDDTGFDPEASKDDEDDDLYEPPMVDSPPYEPNPVVRSPRQALNNGFAGPPLDSHVVAVNHIQYPAAPQPSHISPLTSANFAHQLDNTLVHSSASEAVVAATPKKKKKGKKNAGAAANAVNNQVKGSNKKRKRGVEQQPVSKKNKKKSNADGEPVIKDEPMSPPPLDAITNQSGPPAVQSSRSIEATGPRRTTSQAPFSQVPPGYKLVPIDDDTSPSSRPQYREHAPPAPLPYGRPLVRDDRGIEYYAFTDGSQHAPRAVPSYSGRPPPPHAEAYPPYHVQEYQYYDDPYRRSRDGPPTQHRYVEHGNSSYTEPRPLDDRYHSAYSQPTGPGASPYSRESYVSGPPPVEHRPRYDYPPEPGYSASYMPDPYRQPLPPQHMAPPQPLHYAPPRPHSVHPQGYVEPYQPHATPLYGGPPSASRAASVYPPRHVSGPMPPPPRYDGYESSSIHDARRVSGRY